MIKKMTESNFNDYANIVSDAYPGIGIETLEQKQRLVSNFIKTANENPSVGIFGAFKGDELVGGMKYFDFIMNVLGTKVNVGGLGLVAVHQLHKKEKIALQIVTHFLNYYKDRNYPMVSLYPFNISFYKKMGFGLGASIYQYKVAPNNLPKGKSKANIRFLKEEDSISLHKTYQRYFEKNNGLIEKQEIDFRNIFINPKNRAVGYYEKEELKGYIIYTYQSNKDNFLINDLLVKEMVFENQICLSELLTFLNSQSDQFRYIIFNIQEEDFRFVLENPADDSKNIIPSVFHQTSVNGTGIMYRVIDVIGIFNKLKEHNFNNQTLKLKLNITDTLISDNNRSFILDFKDGFVKISDEGEAELEIGMDISDFSSLLTCSVDFQTLYKYNKVTINKEEYINKVNSIFSSDKKPICLTAF